MSSALVTIDDEALLDVWRDIEVRRRKLVAEEHAVIAEAETRGLAQARGVRSTASFLSQLLRIPPTEATARVKASKFPAPHRAITGQIVPALYPVVVAAAQAAGEISDRHAAVVVEVIEKLPEQVRHLHEDQLEEDLVGWCRQFEPAKVGKLAKRITSLLDPDGGVERRRLPASDPVPRHPPPNRRISPDRGRPRRRDHRAAVGGVGAVHRADTGRRAT